MVLSGSGVEEVGSRAVAASLSRSDTGDLDRTRGYFAGYCPALSSYAYGAEPDRLHGSEDNGSFKTGNDYALRCDPGPCRRDDRILRFCGDCEYL